MTPSVVTATTEFLLSPDSKSCEVKIHYYPWKAGVRQKWRQKSWVSVVHGDGARM